MDLQPSTRRSKHRAAFARRAARRYHNTLNGLEEYYYNGPAGYEAGYTAGLNAFNFDELPGARWFNVDKTQRFVDDNLWLGLALAAAYKQFKDPFLLLRAEQTFKMAMAEWVPGEDMGGLRWMQDLPGVPVEGRALVSNAPAITLGIQLYLLTGKPEYLNWRPGAGVEDLFAWIQLRLRNEAGLYADNINEHNDVGPEIWTYGQGTVIEALQHLNMANPQKYPLAMAVDLTKKAFVFFDTLDKNLLQRQNPHLPDGYMDNAFNGIFFEKVLALAEATHDPDFTELVKSKLHERVRRLEPMYTSLQDQAGALHLAALDYPYAVELAKRSAHA